jgi:beta-N-acetylhexosaminidase
MRTIALPSLAPDSFMQDLSRRTLLASASLLAAPWVARAQGAADDRMIAQMLVLGFSGSSSAASGAQKVAQHLAAGRIGGVCFLGHNTQNRAGIESLTRLFNSSARNGKAFIAVDQEGGAVQRLGARAGWSAIPAAQAVAARNTPEQARGVYVAMARELKAAGFNLNLAPVVDLGFEPKNPIVYKWGRAFGKDGATVAQYAGVFVDAHRSQGVLTAHKHFPGHGSTHVDSHDRPVDLTPTWRADELVPFRDLARRGLIDIVMSGHLTHSRLTGGVPATLSPAAVRLLRQDVGFNGAIMTDDLDMKAIRSAFDLDDAIVRAVAAGHDLILLSNSLKPDDMLPQKAVAAVKAAVAAGRIPRGQIEASAQRIAALSARV